MNKPYGIIAAMVTPMDEAENICLDAIEPCVERLLSSGVHGVFCLGTNGEFYALSTGEKEQVMRRVISVTAGRAPVYVGTGCVTTRETIWLSEQAQIAGADGLSLITPYFGQVSQQKLYDHFAAVADCVDIPVVLYNIPARTGCNIEPSTLEKLAALPNISAIKDSSGNFDNTLRYLECTGRQFPVLAGNDSLILSTLLAGGTGAVSGCANVFPAKLAELYDAFIARDMARSQEIQDGLRPLRSLLAAGNPNSVVKCLANIMGCDVGQVRSPFGIDEQKVTESFRILISQKYQGWS